jgi:S1-C subfamily serine protease
MRKWLIRITVTLAVLFMVGVVYIICAACYWQMSVGVPLEREMGFRHGTPYVQEAGSSWPQEVLTVESVIPGGAFDRAGFKSGDVVRGLSINGLFQALHRGRGQQITIRVVDGGDGPPLDQRLERAIMFVVPAGP